MIHPYTEVRYINDEMGYGVVATQFIPKGTITWVMDRLDRVYTPKEYALLPKEYKEIIDVYAFRNADGNLVLCWDNARYVNHSFNSNCLSTAYNFELAIRDIEEGEQLTDDYGYLNVNKPFRGIDEGTERKIVYPDDLLKYHPIWDGKLIEAFKEVIQVKQPLETFIPNDVWKHALKISRGEKVMDSILKNYYPGNECLTRKATVSE